MAPRGCNGITGWATGQHSATQALLIAIMASLPTGAARAWSRNTMRQHLQQQHLQGDWQAAAKHRKFSTAGRQSEQLDKRIYSIF